MRLSTLVSTLPLVGAASSTVDRRQDVSGAGNTTVGTAVAKSFIIEYTPGHTKRDNAVSEAKDIKVVKTFDSDIFSGASIETDSYNIDSLQALPGVARAWTNEKISLAPIQPQVIDQAQGYVNYTTHNATGVSKLHAQGVFGKGAKVGVVDSGTWYKHPALGGGFGPGFKVAGGRDLVGDGYWPAEGEKEPDSDPLDNIGHGTHVAGIIAGKTDKFVGVAPEATLYSYKVFGQYDSTDEATLIDAFLAAYNDGVDIITASIGLASGWEDNVWGEVASRIVDEGILVTISAGNDGDKGPIEIGNGGAGRNVLAIASLETEVLPLIPFGANFTVGDQTNNTVLGYVPSTDNFPSDIVGWPIIPLTLDTSIPDDGCSPWPAGTVNLTGKIPLVRRGTCSFATKQGNLEALGAEYILFYNNESPMITPGTPWPSSLIVLIPADVGATIIDVYKANGSVTGDFSKDTSVPLGLPDAVANTPSIYTSWGPLYGLQMKPDIAAPGGNIFSTWLDDSWAILSGTSMSCPYVAGVAALYVGAYGGRATHGKDFAKQLAQRIISSGATVPWSDGTSKDFGASASIAQVGNGLVDAIKVVNYDTALTFEKFELNDTRYFNRYHDLTVTNNGNSDISYTFSYESVAGIELMKWDDTYAGRTRAVKKFVDLEPLTLEPKISLPRGFILKPGQSKTVSINFDNPDNLGWNDTLLPLYSGKVVLTSDTGEVLSVPYMGLAADLKRQIDPIYAIGYPWGVSDYTRQNFNQKSYFSFNLSLARQDFPTIYSSIIWGSKETRWDIYEPGWSERDWSYPPVPGENGYIGAATYWYGMADVNYFDPRLYDPNDTLTYPITNVARGSPTFWWFGKLGNGSQIALGNYTIRFATLLPFGNPAHADNWSVFKTPQIQVTGHY